jgi:hypothetical protein
MPANCVMEGSNDGTLATPGGALGVAASMCGRRPIGGFQTKARDGLLRAGFATFAMLALGR